MVLPHVKGANRDKYPKGHKGIAPTGVELRNSPSKKRWGQDGRHGAAHLNIA